MSVIKEKGKKKLFYRIKYAPGLGPQIKKVCGNGVAHEYYNTKTELIEDENLKGKYNVYKVVGGTEKLIKTKGTATKEETGNQSN